MRIESLIIVCVFLVPMMLQVQTETPTASTVKISHEARAIHQSAIIIDTHADTTQRLLDESFDLASVTPVSEGHLDLEKARAGNLAAEFFSIWVDPQKIPREQYAHRTLALIDSVYRQAEKHPDRIAMVFSVDDIMKVHQAG